MVVLLLLGSAVPSVLQLEPAEAAEPIAVEDNAVLRFDFGTRASPVMAGWTQVQGGLLYSRGAGYGWEAAHQDFQNFRPPPEISPHVLQRSWVIGRYGNDMTVDGVRDAGPMTFMADVPDGDYRVRVTVGDLFYPRYSMNITAEGVQVAGELAAFHMVHRSVYQKDARGNWVNYGMPLPYWFDVTVADGRLDVTFDGTDVLFWDRMDVENRTTPPSSYLTAMSTGGDKPGGVNPPYRFIGGPHTVNSVLGLEVYRAYEPLLSETPSGLELHPRVTNTTIQGLVDQYNSASTFSEYDAVADAVREALYDQETGEFTDAAALNHLMGRLRGNLVADMDPSDLDDWLDGLQELLVDNPRDLGLWELLNQTERYRTALDFIFERVETGKNHFYENVKAISLLWTFQEGDPLYDSANMWRARALYMLDPHRWTSASGTGADIMEALRPVDPDNPYVRFYRDTVPGGGRIWAEGQRVVTTTGKVDRWALAEVTEGWEGAPQWARWLHEELYWLYDVTDWWVLNRQQPDGALGGGWSDDVEFIGLFGFDALISQGADDLSLVGAGRFVDGMLASGGVDLERGYSAALADAEHTAEWTGDSLPMMIAVDYGNPKWVEFSYKTGVLMRDLWMGETDLGHLHFRSNYLSATRIGGENTQEDAYINYRAALPASWVGWYNNDPEVEKLLIDWATAWVEDAMRTDDGKPMGVFPASVGFEGDELGGHNSPNWYTAQHPGGTVNYDWQPQMYKGYLVELVRGAYEATGNGSLLEPFRLEAELAQKYLDDPVPEPTPGSAQWAGAILGQKAVDRWEGMRADYGLGGAGGSSGEPNGYTPEDVIGMLRAGRRYIDSCLPLMTTEASATDRVAFVGIINPFMISTGGGIGGALLEPKFTYTGLGRDFAACVMDAKPTGGKILMYGFHHGTRDAGLMPWEFQNHGTYRMVVGNDDDGDGEVDDPPDHEGLFTWETKGQVVPFPLEGGKEKLVVIELLENGTNVRALLPDLAATGDDVAVNATSGALEVLVHNIGSNDTGNFTISILDPDRDDLLIGRTEVASLYPPARLLPSTRLVPVHLFELPAGENVTVVLEPIENLTEITTLNNIFTVEIDTSGLRTNAPPAYVGPHVIALEVEEDLDLIGPLDLRDVAGLFEDPDEGDELRLELVVDGDGAEHVGMYVDNGSLWLVSLEADWNGNVTFRILAWDNGTDGEPGTADDLGATSPTFKLDVRPVNDPPRYIGPPEGNVYYADEDQVITEPLLLDNVTWMFEDVDGDELLYSLYHIINRRIPFGPFDPPEYQTMVELVGADLLLPSVWANFTGENLFYIIAYDLGPEGEPIDVLDSFAEIFPNKLVVRPFEDAPALDERPDPIEMYPNGTGTLNLSRAFRDGDGDLLYILVEDPGGEWTPVLYVNRSSDEPSDPVFIVQVKDGAFRGSVNVTFVCYDRDPVGSQEPPRTASLVVEVRVLEFPPIPPVNRPPFAPNVTSPVWLRGEAGEELVFNIEPAFDPDGGQILVWWEFGDGESTDWSPLPRVTHAYSTYGSYPVTVWVMDTEGLTNSTTVTVEILAPAGPDDGDGDDDDGIGPANMVLGVLLLVVVLAAAWFVAKGRGAG